jgi:aminopeptidase-like protein
MDELIVSEVDGYLRRLFPLCRSITGDANRETLQILEEIIPLQICEISTGTKVYDWVIPDEWVVRDAWISDASGRRIVDFKANNLHLISYSIPVNGRMTWAELKPHVHRHSNLPGAIPYRTSYYQPDWGFCVTHAQYEELSAIDGLLEVVVDTDLKFGSLTYAEYILSGSSEREILISCYICHPSMVNDSLSGVILTAFLARYLTRLSNRKWSYRIIFVPETIGAIAYCATHESAMKAINVGLVITTVGGPGKFGYKQTWDSNHWLNRLIEEQLKKTEQEIKIYPFDIHGSDERQYSSQGFRINVGTISKDRYYEYDEYHTSFDNLSFATAQNIVESYEKYVDLIDEIEKLKFYKNTKPNGEIMLSKYNLYPKIGGAVAHKESSRSEIDIILLLLFFCDGVTPLQDISQKIGVNFFILEEQLKKLMAAGLVEEV